ncbi:glycosyl hydrolase family 76-domain-containing protein [Lasiosphaeria miniovina]|uniref:Mannan endo-1,6-alpha-mannosidase n=1 Tax=Lasiosphaeria miniovina TaxID=1954250 RepID=A0AA40ATL2_9PEZI|nr:glycosyl hydrolase family 76-domain-containing protein [Lasiosphaeria miniovina]KAK0721694.1 glycosyl hydrolase family 76-domain-containing protein [Lasiosphaeria miniovina]
MLSAAISLLLLGGSARAALQVDLTSASSIKKAASDVAYDLMGYYSGNLSGQIPGILPGPPPAGEYYWWEGGALWGTMLDYWHYTGDATYNDVTKQALLFQTGPPQNAYMPRNYTISLGNDDQGFWGMSAMLAAELNFPNPPEDQPQWLELAQAVFNTQAAPDRHDDTCGGGLRWQIPISNIGYDYKNSIANGIFFNLGARLARYTQNNTYAEWAEKTWDWVAGVGMMDDEINVYDGGHVGVNCTDIFKAQFSYNAGVFMQGAAFMYDYTTGEDQKRWGDRVQRLVTRTLEIFFDTGPMIEVSCELEDRISCKTDMLAFKGFLHRWMASTAQLAPFAHDSIMNALKNSTAYAVKACSGGDNGRQCGFRWTTGEYDGLTGAGQEMNVVAALSVLLVDLEKSSITGPYTNTTGGTSQGNPFAGTTPDPSYDKGEVTKGDRVGAGILTAIVLTSLIGALVWMSLGAGESGAAPVKRRGDTRFGKLRRRI